MNADFNAQLVWYISPYDINPPSTIRLYINLTLCSYGIYINITRARTFVHHIFPSSARLWINIPHTHKLYTLIFLRICVYTFISTSFFTLDDIYQHMQRCADELLLWNTDIYWLLELRDGWNRILFIYIYLLYI